MKNYVLKENSFKRFISVGLVTIFTFVISFLPFIIIEIINLKDTDYVDNSDKINQIKQIFSRLFPVERGLVHSYWAPNIYPIYLVLDKLLNKVQTNYNDNSTSLNKSTLGLVKEIQTDILPNINALISNIIVILLSIILMITFIYKKNSKFNLFELLFISGAIFFNFGYHVHEKALISLTLILHLLYFVKGNEHNFITNSNLDNENNKKINSNKLITVDMLRTNEIICKNTNKSFEGLNLFVTFFDLVSFFTQLPLITYSNDYYKKCILILFVVGVNLYFRGIRTNKTIIYVIIFLLLDFYYVIGRNLLLNNKFYYHFLVNITEKYFKLDSTIVIDKILNLEFLHLMLMSLINSIILQYLFVYFVFNYYVVQNKKETI